MPARLFASLRVDYDKAKARHDLSVHRGSRASTIERNRVAEEMAYTTLRQQVEAWIATLATTRHQEIVTKLDAIQSSLNASSSSTDPMPDVVMQVADDPVETDACILCMGEAPDGPALPCCWQGNHRACKGCYMDLFKSDAGQNFRCPSCRKEFKDFVTDVRDVAAVGRFKSFMLGIFPTHERVLDALLNRSETRKLVILKHLAAFNNPDGPLPRMDIDVMLEEAAGAHFDEDAFLEVTVLPDSGFDKCPLWTRLYIPEEVIQSRGDVLYQEMPLIQLSAPGDEIHDFVQRACGGIWFKTYDLIEIRCFNFAYPLHYDFLSYKRIQGRETVLELVVTTGESFVEVDPVEIPFSAIETCKCQLFGLTLFGITARNHELPKEGCTQDLWRKVAALLGQGANWWWIWDSLGDCSLP